MGIDSHDNRGMRRAYRRVESGRCILIRVGNDVRRWRHAAHRLGSGRTIGSIGDGHVHRTVVVLRQH